MPGPLTIFRDAAERVLPAGTAPWAVLLGAVILAWLLHAVIWRWVARLAEGRGALRWQIVRRMRRPVRLILVVAALGLAVDASGLGAEGFRIVEQIAFALLIVLGGWVAVVMLDVTVDRITRDFRLEDEDNLAARKHVTQARVLRQSARILIVLLTAGLVLSTFESVRSYGVSLFASAGAAGLVLGFAARPVLANLIAGIQIAFTQPIRLDDVVIVENEWGWIEEINATYVVVRIWDLRRMVVPLSYFIEKPFQNWTRDSAAIIGTVLWHLDYAAPVKAMRGKLDEFVHDTPLWDGKVANIQVVETGAETIQVRALVSARNAPRAWDLRCEIRERMLEWLSAEHPEALPRTRAELERAPRRASAGGGADGDGPGMAPADEVEIAAGGDGSGVPHAARPAPRRAPGPR
ncbi:mechanosensitive ion channel family protein [Profundibacterium mesophilum]|uniref:Membrane protein n=1 Tax=Profundibacterium mesophilum KAUST100406-0324 TaxID=1037889 RepID=A0A921TEE9_9RHOB|nr:mechanosensitive ion channel family protein [Profundibacterium mesophilum]KAF0677247.1 putative membrane protein [Profundibacterium mesophilum KAUST100406-0324]